MVGELVVVVIFVDKVIVVVKEAAVVVVEKAVVVDVVEKIVVFRERIERQVGRVHVDINIWWKSLLLSSSC